ncbi:hypothetical protein Tco_0422655 [Tanacetum coccineum]
MSTPSTPTVLETIPPADRTRDSPVITPLHDDPYMFVRQTYTPIVTYIESEPFEDPIKTEEAQPLTPRAAPLSLDYTPTSPDYTPNTPRTDEESEPMEASETRTASPSDYTSPLSPDHPLTQTSPTPIPSRAFFYHSTTRMVVRTQPTLSPGYSAKLTKVMTLSPSSFCKRYISSYETPSSSASPVSSSALPIRKRHQGTFKLILDTETKGDESEAEGTGSKSPCQTSKLDIEFDPTSRAPVQTPASPEWSSGSLPISPASLTVPSPVASLVTTPAATIAVDEDEFLEVGAQLKLHGSILHDHTQCLDALPPTLFKGYDRDFTRLFARSKAVHDEINS